MRVIIPHSATLKALIALRFLYVVVNFAVKLHVYDSDPDRTGANATARTGDTRRAHTSAQAYTRRAHTSAQAYTRRTRVSDTRTG